MSGRFLLIAAPEAVAAAFGCDVPWFPPRYNIAPGQPIGIVRAAHGRRDFALVRWGFVPSWVRDPRRLKPFVNARAEGIADKPAFRGAMRHRRCLVPASGWYHWQAGRDGRRRPWLVRPRDRSPVALAGLWEPWLGADGSEVEGALIVTAAADDLAGVADRMPALVAREDHERWLGPGQDAAAAAALLRTARGGAFEAVPVSDRVNNVANEGPDALSGEGAGTGD